MPLATLKAETLAQLIDRRLVESVLVTSLGEISAKDLDAAVETLKLRLESQHKTLESLLAERRSTLPMLRDQLAWQILWERAVAKFLDDKMMEEFFVANRREFDGTEVRASHVLFRPAGRPRPGHDWESAGGRERQRSGLKLKPENWHLPRSS